MRWFPVGVLGVHALIHLMGVFKAFGYAELAQLTQPISRAWGVAWLVAGGLVATTAAMLGAGARSYWMVGASRCLCRRWSSSRHGATRGRAPART